jgi:hypothetical protein
VPDIHYSPQGPFRATDRQLGGSLSFLIGTISNILVIKIGWTDVGSGVLYNFLWFL